MANLLEELKRRNVFRVAVFYVIVGWITMQIADTMFPALNLPEWTIRLVAGLLILGFPIALVLAWALELTPEGIKLEKDVDRSQSVSDRTGRKLDFLIIGLLAVALVVVLAERVFLASPEESAVVAVSPAVTEQSIAVIPFLNMSSDPEQEYFSDGIAEELLNRLAQNKDLRVAARTSSFKFRGENLDVPEIARQLNVAHVLEGSVRKAGNRVRITAQLIKADDGFHMWSETFERELNDIFAIQDEISTAIAEEMEVQLTGRARQAKRTDNLEAYDLYLEGKYYLGRRQWQNIESSIGYFKQAVELDPEFAAAHAALAKAYALLPGYGPHRMGFQEAGRLAREHIDIAMALNPDDPELLVTNGWVTTEYENHWVEAESLYRRALELAPNNAEVHNFYGDYTRMLNNMPQALYHDRRAVELDPLAGVQHWDLANTLLTSGLPEEAIVIARRAIELEPGETTGYDALIDGLLMLGRIDEAEAFAKESAAQVNRAGSLNRWCFDIALARGNETRARECLDNLEAAFDAGDYWAGFVARRALRLDDVERAIDILERGLAVNDITVRWGWFRPPKASTDPRWVAFWARPEFAELQALRSANDEAGRGFPKNSPF